jgi:hypothetical protein
VTAAVPGHGRAVPCRAGPGHAGKGQAGPGRAGTQGRKISHGFLAPVATAAMPSIRLGGGLPAAAAGSTRSWRAISRAMSGSRLSTSGPAADRITSRSDPQYATSSDSCAPGRAGPGRAGPEAGQCLGGGVTRRIRADEGDSRWGGGACRRSSLPRFPPLLFLPSPFFSSLLPLRSPSLSRFLDFSLSPLSLSLAPPFPVPLPTQTIP